MRIKLVATILIAIAVGIYLHTMYIMLDCMGPGEMMWPSYYGIACYKGGN